VDAARQFYLYGASGMEASGWTLQYFPFTSGYTYFRESSRRAALFDWAAKELARLGKLPQGWDDGRAKRITQEAIYGAAWILALVLDADSQRPQFFPIADGGIQIEWYANGDEITIEIDHTGKASVLAEFDGQTAAEDTFDPQSPGSETSTIAKLVKELSDRVAEARRNGGMGA
jgi:hypothetical protein